MINAFGRDHNKAARPTRPAPKICCTCTVTTGATAELDAALAAIEALFEILLRLWLTLAVACEALALTELKLALAALEALLAADPPDALDKRDESAEEILAEIEERFELIDEILLAAAEDAELRLEERIDVAEVGFSDALDVSTSVDCRIVAPPPAWART